MTSESAQSAAESLAELAPRLGRIIANALESDPGIALSLRQYRLLERLTDRPHRTGELATGAGVTQPTASAAVASLEARGLVARKPDPDDRRATLIEINDRGSAVFAEARERVLQRLSIVTADMTAEDAGALAALQPILVTGMDRLRDERRNLARGRR